MGKQEEGIQVTHPSEREINSYVNKVFMAKDVKVLKEDIIPSDISPRDMTTDCHFVHYEGGIECRS